MKKVLIFRSPKKLNITVPNIKLNNFILSPKKTVTSLGIEINENLSCNKEIEILAKKISRRNGILLQKIPLKKPLFSHQKQYENVFQKCFTVIVNILVQFSDLLKLQDIIQFNILKLYNNSIIQYPNDQLSLKVKNIFIQNEPVNPYNTRNGKQILIPHINATHFGSKSFR